MQSFTDRCEIIHSLARAREPGAGRAKIGSMEFSERLKVLRAAIGINQAAMSKVLRLSVRTYERYESGASSPTAQRLKSIIPAIVALERIHAKPTK